MAQQNQYIWGFMLENTLFVEFDQANHIIIENSYQQKKTKQASHHIVIRDSHLPCDAKVYFGVAQIHLRMPGTRYYVKRKSLPVITTSAPITATAQDVSNFHLNSHQNHPYQKQQQKHGRLQQKQQQYNRRRRQSQVVHPLTNRASSNNLYMDPSQRPVPSESLSLPYTLSNSTSTSSSTSASISTPILPTFVSPSSSTMIPYPQPTVLSDANHIHSNPSLAPSYSPLVTIENISSTSVQPNEVPSIADDPFSNLWNSSWLDSLYATSSTSSMQALLIPWSTTPPPSSSTMFNHHVL